MVELMGADTRLALCPGLDMDAEKKSSDVRFVDVSSFLSSVE